MPLATTCTCIRANLQLRDPLFIIVRLRRQFITDNVNLKIAAIIELLLTAGLSVSSIILEGIQQP